MKTPRIKLEVGKTYKNRNGEQVKIISGGFTTIAGVNSPTRYYDEKSRAYTASGKSVYSREKYDFDLVKEVN